MKTYNWESTAGREKMLFDTIINNYSVAELCANVSAGKEDYVSAAAATGCYTAFEAEINELIRKAQLGTLTCHHCGAIGHGHSPAKLVGAAIKEYSQVIFDQYGEMLALHPDKAVADIVNFGFYNKWSTLASGRKYQAYKTVESFVRNEFTGGELYTARQAEARYHQVGIEQAAQIFKVFAEELKKTGRTAQIHYSARSPSLATVIREYVVATYDKVFTEHRVAILQHPTRTINAALAKEAAKANPGRCQ